MVVILYNNNAMVISYNHHLNDFAIYSALFCTYITLLQTIIIAFFILIDLSTFPFLHLLTSISTLLTIFATFQPLHIIATFLLLLFFAIVIFILQEFFLILFRFLKAAFFLLLISVIPILLIRFLLFKTIQAKLLIIRHVY